MTRFVTGSGVMLAAALLILASTLGPVDAPTVGSIYGGTALATPVLLIASELRP
jgi:hypothetical protein